MTHLFYFKIASLEYVSFLIDSKQKKFLLKMLHESKIAYQNINTIAKIKKWEYLDESHPGSFSSA